MRVPEGLRVLDLGCGAGHLLAALRPSQGVGIDVSAPAVREARERHGGERLRFLQGDFADPAVLAEAGGPFDVVLLVNVVTHLTDVQATLEALHAVVHSRTRVLIYSYSRLWQPMLRLAEMLGMKYAQPPESWLPPEEVKSMLSLADFEVVRDDAHLVCPVRVPLLADLLNRYVGRLPLLDALSLVFGIVARPAPARTAAARPVRPSVSVVIPCRNESGHIRPLVESLPALPEGIGVPLRRGQLHRRHRRGHRAGGRGEPRASPCASSASRARARATPCASASPRRRATCSSSSTPTWASPPATCRSSWRRSRAARARW